MLLKYQLTKQRRSLLYPHPRELLLGLLRLIAASEAAKTEDIASQVSFQSVAAAKKEISRLLPCEESPLLAVRQSSRGPIIPSIVFGLQASKIHEPLPVLELLEILVGRKLHLACPPRFQDLLRKDHFATS
jgi:hypothetical protein